jgi:integrase
MNARVWTFQIAKDVRKLGADKASHYVGWYFDGKRHSESCGPGTRGKKEAERRSKRIEAELLTGTHDAPSRKTWAKFRADFEAKSLPNLAIRSRDEVKTALDHFQRIAKPNRMDRITAAMIDGFIATRRTERGKNRESTLSVATVNKDLRHIRSVLGVAHEWGCLPKLPRIKLLREPVKLPRFVTAEHFATLYRDACDLATLPANPGQHYSAADWWRALLTMLYLTGWRIGETLALSRNDLDLESGTAITRAVDNKGKRDERVPLHPAVCEHLRVLVTPPPVTAGERRPVDPSPLVFRWVHDRKLLWQEFRRIQAAVGIKLDCPEKHEHTPACGCYGFHDLRRSYATVMAPKLKPEALQKLMRHKSYSTTLRYVALGDQLRDAVAMMPVPDVLRPEVEPAGGYGR